MADTIMINPASGDSTASLFSDPDSLETPLESVSKGTILKVVSSAGKFYQVEYDNGVPNKTRGGSAMEGTVVGYPYSNMYSDVIKSSIVGLVNNGTSVKILDDSEEDMIYIEAFTTQGSYKGYVEARCIYRNLTDEEREEMENPTPPQQRKARANNSFDKEQNVKVTGTVTATELNIRSGPGKENPSQGTLKNGATVNVGEIRNGWINIGGGQWVSGKYIKIERTNTTASVSKSDATLIKNSNQRDTVSGDFAGVAYDGGGNEFFKSFVLEDEQYTFDEYYAQLAQKYTHALGTPPKYNMDIDIQYTDELTPGRGRVMNKTLLSNPSILSLCPGKVKMFPYLMGMEKDTMFEAMQSAAGGSGTLLNKIAEDEGSMFSSKMYAFSADTATYAKYVNAMCRGAAIMLGIGNKTMPNTTSKLKHFDYTYWTIRKKYNPAVAEASDNDKSIFRKFFEGLLQTGKSVINNAVSDTTYINFFLNGSETDISESITTSVADSPLAGIFDTISSAAATLNYFTGSGFGVGGEDVERALQDAVGDPGDTMRGILNIAENFLKGGRMVLPKMVEGASYGKSVNVSMKFMSLYGDKYSVFLRCIVPICHILAMSLPKQLSDNMYTFPFVIRGAQLGQTVIDLGIITSVNIRRGGSDNTSWTIDTLATEWEVDMEITPLVDELMITSTSNPVLFCKNEGLLDYLANFCGFDMLANNLNTKLEMMGAFIANVPLGWPRNLENHLNDALFNKINRFFRAVW